MRYKLRAMTPPYMKGKSSSLPESYSNKGVIAWVKCHISNTFRSHIKHNSQITAITNISLIAVGDNTRKRLLYKIVTFFRQFY